MASPLFEVIPGGWRGEIVGGGTLHFGQVVQTEPSSHSVELTYIVLPALLIAPRSGLEWPCVAMIMVPKRLQITRSNVGSLLRTDALPSLTVSLETGRRQFSDMLPLLQKGRLKKFCFELGPPQDDDWPIQSWGMSSELGHAEGV